MIGLQAGVVGIEKGGSKGESWREMKGETSAVVCRGRCSRGHCWRLLYFCPNGC